MRNKCLSSCGNDGKMMGKILFPRGKAYEKCNLKHGGELYKNEKAIITAVQQSFNLAGSIINYTIQATSGAALGTSSCLTFPADGKKHKPSTLIKNL